MAQITQNPQPRHLTDHLPTKTRQPRIVQLRVARPGVVLRVVGELHLADTEVREDAQVVELVFYAGGVFPVEDGGFVEGSGEAGG